MRAGWSILLFPALVTVRSVAHRSAASKPGGAGKVDSVPIGEAIRFAALAFSALIVSRIERRPFAAYGLRAARAARAVPRPIGAALLSGGTTGPEGSVLVIPTLALSALVIHRTSPKRATAFDA